MIEKLNDFERELLSILPEKHREHYAGCMHSEVEVSMYSEPSADIHLDRISTLSIEPDHIPLSNVNWGIAHYGSDADYQRLFDEAIPGRKVEFIVMDTGIPNHKDFGKANRGGVYYPGEEWYDRNGHATAVGSYLASTNPDTCGLYRHCEGEDPSVWAYYFGVLSTRGSGSFALIADRARAVAERTAYNTDRGVLTIVNLSLGGRGNTNSELSAALKAINDAGGIVIAASGNDGAETISTPANDANALATGALGLNDLIASYSNRGPGMYQVGPGSHIYSAIPGNQYAFRSGTSMATPMSSYPYVYAWLMYSGLKTAKDVVEFVQARLKDYGSPGYDTVYGYGGGIFGLLQEGPVDDTPRTIRKRVISTKLFTNLFIYWKTRNGEYSGKVALLSASLSFTSDKPKSEVQQVLKDGISQVTGVEFVIPDDRDEFYLMNMVALKLKQDHGIIPNGFDIMIDDDPFEIRSSSFLKFINSRSVVKKRDGVYIKKGRGHSFLYAPNED